MGNCGFTLAPCTDGGARPPHAHARAGRGHEPAGACAPASPGAGRRSRSTSTPSRALRPALNVGALIGHSALRYYVLDDAAARARRDRGRGRAHDGAAARRAARRRARLLHLAGADALRRRRQAGAEPARRRRGGPGARRRCSASSAAARSRSPPSTSPTSTVSIEAARRSGRPVSFLGAIRPEATALLAARPRRGPAADAADQLPADADRLHALGDGHLRAAAELGPRHAGRQGSAAAHLRRSRVPRRVPPRRHRRDRRLPPVQGRLGRRQGAARRAAGAQAADRQVDRRDRRGARRRSVRRLLRRRARGRPAHRVQLLPGGRPAAAAEPARRQLPDRSLRRRRAPDPARRPRLHDLLPRPLDPRARPDAARAGGAQADLRAGRAVRHRRARHAGGRRLRRPGALRPDAGHRSRDQPGLRPARRRAAPAHQGGRHRGGDRQRRRRPSSAASSPARAPVRCCAGSTAS